MAAAICCTGINKYTFPFEEKFSDKAYAENVSDFFVQELLRNGTTTALIFTTVYPHATDAIFSAAEKKNMRIIAGKVVADRNVPDYLMETPKQAYIESEKLIKKWHHKSNTRLLYAITLRFAPTTSPEMFTQMMRIKKQYPDVYVHTHISENKAEVKWVKDLYKQHENYLAVYDHYELLGKNTLLAHGVYLTPPEFNRIAQTKTSIAFCPTSNLFLGSGLFDFNEANKHGVSIGLGTDVGAGTSFSALYTMNEAYKVMQLQQDNLSAFQAFYLATLGGAKALNLEDKLGNFLPGKEADFVVLDIQGATPLLKRRLTFAEQLDDKLFILMALGDDRSIIATYVAGQPVFIQKLQAVQSKTHALQLINGF
ncbi:MAG: guanine deaminase [Legionellales bacterium]|jgi:guanine deaminase